MAERMSMNLRQDPHLVQKQTQRLIMLPEMQQALSLLQMPVIELAAVLTSEMEQNPLLETSGEEAAESEDEEEITTPVEPLDEKEVNFDETNFEILKVLDEEFRDHFSQDEIYSCREQCSEDARRQTFVESLISREESLGEHLLGQARESFDQPEDFRLANLLIGYLDQSGFLNTPLQEIASLHQTDIASLERVLAVIQTFDPIGIGAKSLQQSLLVQLRAQGKELSLAYQIVSKHWEDLLHHRIPAMAKAEHCSHSQVSEAIAADIAKLELHPANHFTSVPSQTIVPDLSIDLDGEQFTIRVNDEPLPTFRFNHRYLRMLNDPSLSKEVKDFIKQKLGSARWLRRIIDQRESTLYRIAELLVRLQKPFFSSAEGQLKPLTMKAVADELALHESTIARAVANKYVDCPRGVIPLRSFFTNAYVTENGDELSSRTVREALEALIVKENKAKPLSDEALSRLLKAQGIPCARRTVAKYRSELRIGTATQRKVF